jgi:cobalt-zinc-cadmium efflux system outer membrane protein
MKLAALIVLLAVIPIGGMSQPLSREAAINASVARGGRAALAAADTASAKAQLLGARALENPAFNATWSKSAPQLHFSLEMPVPFPGGRRLRINSAQASVRAAGYRYQFERAAARLDADTTYTRALAAAARARLSTRNAFVADTLVQIAIARRNAGDASDLEVELARVNAGQERNLAIADSLELLSVLADLATVTAAPSGSISSLADSLVLPDTSITTSSGVPLQIAAGDQSVVAAQRAVGAERRSVFGSPALMAGFETHDPAGDEKGILPTYGITLPIPFLNRNRAGIAAANAELIRARAELAVTRVEYDATLARVKRQRSIAYQRAILDRQLLASANRVASMSVRAYREGAFPLSNVFEAQRSARDVLRQYVDDLADVWIADALLRVLTLTVR